MNEPLSTAGESTQALILHTLRETVRQHEATIEALNARNRDLERSVAVAQLATEGVLQREQMTESNLNDLLSRSMARERRLLVQFAQAVRALRELVGSLLAELPFKYSEEWGDKHLKAVTEAQELLRVIDAQTTS